MEEQEKIIVNIKHLDRWMKLPEIQLFMQEIEKRSEKRDLKEETISGVLDALCPYL